MSKSRAQMPPQPATEAEIREALLLDLKAESWASAAVREEFSVEGGSARIDVAVIGETLIGFEIKSDFDTFSRFSNQIHAYNRVFDAITLVCGSRHVEHAAAILPSWWGIISATKDAQSNLQLTSFRPARQNTRQEAISLASLLWRDEALEVLASENQKTSSKASSYTLWEQIANSLPLDGIKEAVMGVLSRRFLQSAETVNAM